MIKIVQNGVSGSASLIFDMHRLRARVFAKRLNWNVHVDNDGLEVDQFDLPSATYLLSLNNDGRVNGSWRILPTTGPTMIRDIWPAFLETLPMPHSYNTWEVSRFAVDPLSPERGKAMAESNTAVAEMFCALTELCIIQGIRQIYTLYDERIARVLKRIDCQPGASSSKLNIDGYQTQIASFETDREMLKRIRAATGIRESLINFEDLPPAFKNEGYCRVVNA